jgi:DNA polymerase III epsilon subunit-like protein
MPKRLTAEEQAARRRLKALADAEKAAKVVAKLAEKTRKQAEREVAAAMKDREREQKRLDREAKKAAKAAEDARKREEKIAKYRNLLLDTFGTGGNADDFERFIFGGKVVDLETTGKGEGDRIAEVAVVSMTGRVDFHSFVNPEVEFDPEALEKTGFNPRDCEFAPTWPEIFGEAEPYLIRAYAWNGGFDGGMVKQTCAAYGLDGRVNIRDCRPFYYKLRGKSSFVRLSDALAAEGLGYDGKAHSAETDARATAALLMWLWVDLFESPESEAGEVANLDTILNLGRRASFDHMNALLWEARGRKFANLGWDRAAAKAEALAREIRDSWQRPSLDFGQFVRRAIAAGAMV